MADRRMFSKRIVGSGKFLRMPPTSRLLYYDLGMAADDDGVVEAYSVMLKTKATEDDLRVLVAKGYISILNEDLVAYILDWNTSNTIRKDRYHESFYKDLLVRFMEQSDGQLATNCQPSGNQLTTKCQPNGNRDIDLDIDLDIDTDIGNVEGKKKRQTTKRFVPPAPEEVYEYVMEKGYYIDPEAFVDFYESKNWMVGKNKMKNWKAAVRTWARREKEKYGNRVNSKPPEHKSEFEEFYI